MPKLLENPMILGNDAQFLQLFFCRGCLFLCRCLFVLFLFANGVAEVAQLSSQRKVFSVGVCQKAALLQIQLALAVQKGFFHIDTSDFCFKYGVRP